MFTKILIANRGEIACRIIDTVKRLGITSVAVYSTIDRSSLHVKKADEAYCIGEPLAKDSYLNIAAIIAAAKESQAEAIHPGYGFLSENADFVQACIAHNIVFIGPSVESMQAMASKQLAKQLLSKTQVPLIPGYQGTSQDDLLLLQEAERIGFPILLKAASGGGGKGMRVVNSAGEFAASLAACRREALASFADSTMIIEKLIENPRHVEMQIIADNFGTVLHLFDRDCSLQRRHQKIIEEAPAPNLDESLRCVMREAAITVAQSIHYTNAGTIEFLVDRHGQFYFMEMNTRLQVEHPVTEMITGIDLVEWQILVAANNPLPCPQDHIPQRGHAVECRVYAEDPEQQFIPSTGTIHFLKPPVGIGIRIDTGIIKHSSITHYYDPMIAKLIVWGETRAIAIQRMRSALNQYAIGGIKTNLSFLKAICSHPVFIDARMTTHFLNDYPLALPSVDTELALLFAASHDYLFINQQQTDPIFIAAFAWHAPSTQEWLWKYEYNGSVFSVLIKPINAQTFSLVLNEKCVLAHAEFNHNSLIIEAHNQRHSALFDNQDLNLNLYFPEGNITISRYRGQAVTQAIQNGSLAAPMPATIVAILVKAGDVVKKTQPLIIVEAMKMEHTLNSPDDGTVKEVFFSLGAQVDEGVELLQLSTD